MGESGIRAVRIKEALAFDMPMVKALFARAADAEGEMDASEVLEWCVENVTDERFFTAIALDDFEPVGLIIATYWPGPFSKEPFCALAYSSTRLALDSLMWSMRDWAIGVSGINTLAFLNGSGAQDDAYIRRLRKFSQGRVVCSLIRLEWDGGEKCQDYSDSVPQVQSRKTLPRRNSRNSVDSLETRFSATLSAAGRNLLARLRRILRVRNNAD